jgi:hypothetical protein
VRISKNGAPVLQTVVTQTRLVGPKSIVAQKATGNQEKNPHDNIERQHVAHAPFEPHPLRFGCHVEQRVNEKEVEKRSRQIKHEKVPTPRITIADERTRMQVGLPGVPVQYVKFFYDGGDEGDVQRHARHSYSRYSTDVPRGIA